MRLTSKWSYMFAGMNISFVIIGAVCGSMVLILMGMVIGIFNYYIAEINRGIEDEQIRKESKEIDE
jgi:hypothetical protein